MPGTERNEDALPPRTYPQGVPSWIDGRHADVDAAEAFYSALFGWSLSERLPPQAPGSYRIATRDGLDVGALASLADGAASGWVTYFAVDDADQTAQTVRDAGGEVFGLEDAGRGGAAGRSAFCRDDRGVLFGLWQARERLGSQYINRPGGWVFSDLRTPDPEAHLAFYRKVFGWAVMDMGPDSARMLGVPGYGDHLAATSDPHIRERQAGAPAGFADVFGAARSTDGPATWQVGFSVADRDAAAQTIERLGGRIVATADEKWTRLADALDPQGVAFTITQFVQQR
ncbi:hypothetical protein AX769_16540 [Frondihabitans sp. PAMC 28766]|uniref:VOC family protein n=1 Tax=Frondihabitans sp. PAMC 28766 TaxID=1795630 RepID=UPI00078ECA91|nr:VOC family protein [Frondihabitans sp. PAMC 28766]AMM21446.1 hypothetical protein AX769_16540 [Frondihabitans sp. PAMC 28766]